LCRDGPPIEDWKRRWRGSSPKGSGLRNTNRRRIMSISSLAMPGVQGEDVDIRENDDEEFVVINTQLRPSQVFWVGRVLGDFGLE
jgi:hypothetical protein